METSTSENSEIIITDESSSSEYTEFTSVSNSEITDTSTTDDTSVSDITEKPGGENTTQSPPPYNGFVFSWWSFLLGVALGIVFSSLMFGLTTWCWWLSCVRWKSSSQLNTPSESIPRLEVVSTPGSRTSIMGRTPPSSYGKHQNLRNKFY